MVKRGMSWILCGLTYYLSGVPKARPLEGWVRWPVNDALLLLKSLTERSAERCCARLRFERQKLTCIRSLYFKLGAMANASTRAGQRRAQVSLAAAQMCGEASALVPGHSPMRASEIGFEEQGNCDKRKHCTRESEDHGLRGFEEHAKPRSYTNRGNDRRPGNERQKAT